MKMDRRSSNARVGLKQIADELGVSISLVSKVLSGNLGTSGATAERISTILEKAKEVGYRKNLLAEALRTGRQNAVAVYVHRHGLAGTSIVDEMMMGIAEEASRLHQRLIIHYYETPEEFQAFHSRVYANAVDGIIVGGFPHHELVGELRKLRQDLPVITILDRAMSDDFPNIGMDPTEITRRSTLHLIERGCRRIAHIRCTDNRGAVQQAKLRYEGYIKALTEKKIPIDPKLILDSPDYTYDAGEAATKRLLDGGVTFDGVVGQSDQHAVGALNLLVRQGIDVPRDVKVIGIDNAPFCDFTYVKLSSVSQEFHARGKAAMSVLVGGLNGEPVVTQNFAPVIVARRSTEADA